MVCAIRSVFTINSALLFACKRQSKTNPKCEYFCFSVLFEKVKALQGTFDEFCYEVFPQKQTPIKQAFTMNFSLRGSCQEAKQL